SLFKFSLPSSIDLDFKICSPKNDLQINEKILNLKKNMFYKEYCFRVHKDITISLSRKNQNYKIIASHSWTDNGKKNPFKFYSSLIFFNNADNFIETCATPSYNAFAAIYDDFVIGDNSKIYLGNNRNINYYDLVNLMLYKDEGKIQVAVDDIKETVIKQEYNFSHLFPDVVFIKEILEEYLNSTSNISIQ
ncbi:hypothetical protein HEI48_001715, partial [Campylobacter jejuni]|nr:hypothetical protein [Campylobacter jejuni]